MGALRSRRTLLQACLVGGGHGSSVDLQRFEQCTTLRYLTIQLDDCHLMNGEFLPRSLTYLSINGPLSYSELLSIRLNLPKLKQFELTSNIRSMKYQFHGTEIVVPAKVDIHLLKVFLTQDIRLVTFEETRIDVVEVMNWLRPINGIQFTIQPIEGQPEQTHGRLQIRMLSNYQ